MLSSPVSTTSSGFFPINSVWNRVNKKAGNKDKEKEKDKPKDEKALQQANMALSRQRLMTLVYGEMETVRMLPNSYADLEAVARDWVKPPPDASFQLRIPVEFASFQASRFITGPYIWINSEDSYQIAILGVQGSRIEISSDAPPPPDEPPPPPPPPVLEMEGIFNLELNKGQHVAIDVTISSDELDMARTEDGTTVDGSFWGKLDIVHDGDTHTMEFSGTRLQDTKATPDFLFDSRVMNKLTVAAKPTTARCTLSILAPSQQYCEVNVAYSPMWKVGMTWPPAESLSETRFKYFLRVHPGGALEHFESESVVTSLYYEAIPDVGSIDPQYIAAYNSFAMPFKEFIPHITKVLETLGLSLQARTNFVNNNLSAFSAHKNIAYRFMPPGRLGRAIEVNVTADPCVWTRIFLMFRGVSDEDLAGFEAGEKEAMDHNWREIIGYSDGAKDQEQFRILEVSVLDCS